ncbi:MAG: hypothetical protein RMJ56_13175 [Gemmataceae bacterium]|nr:zinc-ribbon domain-containing protein [Gemmata sp.]MDW8198548.1 hypothetical protein [Gemmataceae bacterium]
MPMRLVCPHCLNEATFPDDAAGKEVTCPHCAKSFPTPTRHPTAVTAAMAEAAAGPIEPIRSLPHPEMSTPTQSAPPPPPGDVPPPSASQTHPTGVPSPPASSSPDSAVATAPAGLTRTWTLTISPQVVAWMPALLLTVVLLSTAFPWVGCFVGDSAVYAQRPWGAMFGLTPYRNFQLEEAGVIPSGWLDRVPSDWRLLVPFFLLLFVALVFAWAERGLSSVDPRQIPPLAKLWPWRNAIIVGCTTLAFVVLILQAAQGFSLERAIHQHIAQQFADRWEKAANSAAEQARLEYLEEQVFRSYNVAYTKWFYLAIISHFFAIVTIVLRLALDRRGSLPPPRVVLYY